MILPLKFCAWDFFIWLNTLFMTWTVKIRHWWLNKGCKMKQTWGTARWSSGNILAFNAGGRGFGAMSRLSSLVFSLGLLGCLMRLASWWINFSVIIREYKAEWLRCSLTKQMAWVQISGKTKVFLLTLRMRHVFGK